NSRPGREDRRGLREHDADIRRADQSGGDLSTHRLAEDAEARAVAAARRGVGRAVGHTTDQSARGKAVSSAVLEPAPAPPPPGPVRGVHYLNAATGVTSWLLPRDHNRIGIFYLLTVTAMFVLGSVAIGIVRLHLMPPDGALVDPDTYNRLFTMHG